MNIFIVCILNETHLDDVIRLHDLDQKRRVVASDGVVVSNLDSVHEALSCISVAFGARVRSGARVSSDSESGVRASLDSGSREFFTRR